MNLRRWANQFTLAMKSKKSNGAFGKARKRIPIYKQYGYSSMAEHDWRRWGTLNNYFNQKGHPKQKRAEEAIAWGREFDNYNPEKEQKEGWGKYNP